MSGLVTPQGAAGGRRLADMLGLFLDTAALEERVRADNPVVYMTSTAPVPAQEGHLGFNQTRIEPGDVGGELFMTHGHVHVRPEGETYIGQSGQGGIVLSRDGRSAWVPMEAGVIGYIPPGWTHRSVNTGSTPFVFISVYPALSGQDYDPVRRYGVGARVRRTAGQGYQVVRDDGGILHTG